MNPKDLNRRKFLKVTGAAVAVAAAGNLVNCSQDPRQFDIIIRNGLIIDGSGSPGFTGSVGIIDDLVSDIGILSNAAAPVVIDAEGLVIAPGLINIHSHTGSSIVNNPGYSSILQGVTTEIAGQDGSSRGPSDEGRNIGDYLDELSQQELGLNFATMVGHGTIRGLVIGQSDREPSSNELARMRSLVDEAIQSGAVGFSTGLEYTPGSFAKTPELIEMAKALEPYGLPYTSHMRNEDNFLLEAVEEALTIGRDAGCPVQISHLKVQGESNWDKIDPLFEMIETASSQRGNVHFDRYPYVAYSTGLSNLFPTWSREGGRFLERLSDASLEKEITTYVVNKVRTLGSWNSVMVSRARAEEDQKYAGWRMDEIAADKNTEPYAETVAMLLRNGGSVGMVGFGMGEENTKRILSHPLGMICSDGSAMTTESSGSPHPRNFGAFARVLGHYSRDEKIFDLPTAIHKMTAMPAEKLLLEKRGKLKRDFFADIVVFDPDNVKDNATFQKPKQYAEGIRYVLVNGKFAVKDGKHTGVLAGCVLRNKA